MNDSSNSKYTENNVLPSTVKFYLLGIVVLGAALRLYQLGDDSLWYDEGGSLAFARFVGFDLTIFRSDICTEAPMQAVLLRIWQAVFGLMTNSPVISAANDFAIRLLPCAFGIAGIPLIFILARRLLQDDAAGLIAALFFAVSPFQLFYAQELRVYTIFVVVALGALYFVYRAVEENRTRHWVVMTFFLVLLMYTHYISVWTIFSFNVAFVFLLLYPKYRNRFWPWFNYHLAMMALIAPTLYILLKLYKSMQQIKYSWYPNTTAKTFFVTFKDLFAGYGFNPSVGPIFYYGLLFLALGLALFGLYTLRQKPWACFLLGGSAFIPIVGNVLQYMSKELCFYEHRHFIFCGVAATILIAQGVRSLPRPKLQGIVAAAFILLTIPSILDYYAGRIHPIKTHRIGIYARVDFRAAAAYLEDHWQEGDMLGHSSTFTIFSMQHYLPKPQRQLGGDATQLTGNVAIVLTHGLEPYAPETGTKDAARVWLIEASPDKITFASPNQAEEVRTWLDENMHAVQREDFDGLSVSLYERTPVNDSDIG
jgi:uncharacterized membrane protein